MGIQQQEARAELLKKTDEELRMLHMQVLASEEIDIDYITCITDILAERHPEEFDFDEEGVLDAVLQIIEEDEGGKPAETEQPNAPVKTRKHRTLRNMIAIAAVLAAVVMAMAAIPVQGSSLISTIAHWTSELFSFGSEEIEKTGEDSITMEGSPDSMELYNLLIDNGVTTPLAPKFIPEEFILRALINESEDEDHQKYYAEFLSESGNTIAISIRNYGTTDPVIEKDDTNVTVYQQAGIDHYIYKNMDSTNVSWDNGSYSGNIFFVSDAVDETTLKYIIDSIYAN